MTSSVREGRVDELSESNYLMLRDTHNLVRELKGMVDRLHQTAVTGGGTSFDLVAALKLTVDRLYDELERYLRPGCDPDSAYDAALTEKPAD